MISFNQIILTILNNDTSRLHVEVQQINKAHDDIGMVTSIDPIIDILLLKNNKNHLNNLKFNLSN